MGTEDGEDDYMGDLGRFLDPRLLQPTAQKPAAPTIIGSNHKIKGKGKMSWLDKRKAKREQTRTTEDNQRSEGLNSAIPSSNIGFKMLQQMGYKPGAALGKHGQGALEPIKMDLKHSRTGLGVDEIERLAKAKKAKQLELKLQLKKRKDEITERDFQERQRSSWQTGKILRDYRKATVTLAQLEESIGIRKEATAEDDGDAEEDDEEVETVTEEDLMRVLEDLRSRFYYCIYCGCKYDSAEELGGACPGVEEDAH